MVCGAPSPPPRTRRALQQLLLASCAASHAAAQECDAAEPDLAGANMRPVCTDFCDSTPADTECGHACLEGYVGGMVRCVGGAYEVTPCYVACANWETSQASAVWGEVHMQPLGGAARGAIATLNAQRRVTFGASLAASPAAQDGPGFQVGAKVQLRHGRGTHPVASINTFARTVTLGTGTPPATTVGQRVRLVDNPASATGTDCGALPRHAVLLVESVDNTVITFDGELLSAGEGAAANCLVEWLDEFSTCAAAPLYTDMTIEAIDPANGQITLSTPESGTFSSTGNGPGCDLVSEACAAGSADCHHQCKPDADGVITRGGRAICQRASGQGGGGDLTLVSCSTAAAAAVSTIDDSTNTVTLSSADSSIVAGQQLRLSDTVGNTCAAAPKDQDLTVLSVAGAVITFSTDIVAGDGAAAANCAAGLACTEGDLDGTCTGGVVRELPQAAATSTGCSTDAECATAAGETCDSSTNACMMARENCLVNHFVDETSACTPCEAGKTNELTCVDRELAVVGASATGCSTDDACVTTACDNTEGACTETCDLDRGTCMMCSGDDRWGGPTECHPATFQFTCPRAGRMDGNGILPAETRPDMSADVCAQTCLQNADCVAFDVLADAGSGMACTLRNVQDVCSQAIPTTT